MEEHAVLQQVQLMQIPHYCEVSNRSQHLLVTEPPPALAPMQVYHPPASIVSKGESR